ncbi:hypothetical protein KAR91_67145 [Candidatus Pacearchaeota archaeon]|nr:hypothetical protein [Candidatus Pacearchaeota archaeon]
MSNEIPNHLGKPLAITTELDTKDIQIRKLQEAVLKLEIRNSELEREIIHLNSELLNYASAQFNLNCMLDGGYGNDN